ncbi:uncharacterized protein LOC109710679 [Ananas comosus]|uniref:Uncharacterized protein LOC109710679 n=1 Tax=Ananas comosus TaxID=4615 RepID=A0A6P5EYU1_ANACO|nr:uncharacterized protein LOC109710679 [Ananas comosus]
MNQPLRWWTDRVRGTCNVICLHLKSKRNDWSLVKNFLSSRLKQIWRGLFIRRSWLYTLKSPNRWSSWAKQQSPLLDGSETYLELVRWLDEGRKSSLFSVSCDFFLFSTSSNAFTIKSRIVTAGISSRFQAELVSRIFVPSPLRLFFAFLKKEDYVLFQMRKSELPDAMDFSM